MNIEQMERKQEKLKILLIVYRERKHEIGSIKELSEILGSGFSKSTIQRYFHEMYNDFHMIDLEEYNDICEWLKGNIKDGQSRGGTHFQEKYGYSQDELGHFNGGKKL